MAVDLHSRFAQGAGFLQKGDRVEHHAVADHAAAPVTQHAAGHKLKNEFLAVDDDGAAGIVSPGIAGHDGEVLRQYVDDLPLALIAPLGAYNHRSLAFFQCQLRHGEISRQISALRPGSHTPCPAGMPSQKITGVKSREDVYGLSYRVFAANSNAPADRG